MSLLFAKVITSVFFLSGFLTIALEATKHRKLANYFMTVYIISALSLSVTVLYFMWEA